MLPLTRIVIASVITTNNHLQIRMQISKWQLDPFVCLKIKFSTYCLRFEVCERISSKKNIKCYWELLFDGWWCSDGCLAAVVKRFLQMSALRCLSKKKPVTVGSCDVWHWLQQIVCFLVILWGVAGRGAGNLKKKQYFELYYLSAVNILKTVKLKPMKPH